MNYIVHLCVLGAFVLGYIMGRVDLLARRLSAQSAQPAPAPTGFFQTNKSNAHAADVRPQAKVADIDTSKFVAPISTAGMERKDVATLGKTTVIADDIQTSVSRLAQLKGK